MSRRLLPRTVRALVTARFVLLPVALCLVLIAQFVTPKLDFDRKVTNLLRADSPQLASFKRLKRSFGGNEIVLAVYRDAQLLAKDGSGIQRLKGISQQLEAVPGVRSTLSLDKLDTPMAPIHNLRNGLSGRLRDLFEGYTHNADGTIAVVVCMLDPAADGPLQRTETIGSLREIIQHLPAGIEPGMLTGEPVMLVDGFRYVEQDGRRLSIWSSLLLGLTVLVCFRSVRWMLICIAVVQLALMLTHLTMAGLGLRLSMVSSMLTAVVTVVGVATVVHLIVRYRDAQQSGQAAPAALYQAFRILLIPIAWACVTDAVGFSALKSASVAPVGDFGVMMGISCLAVLVSVWLLVPGLATASERTRAKTTQAVTDGKLRAALYRSSVWVQQHRVSLSAVAVTLIALSLWGLQFLQVETDFTRNFRRDAEIVQAYQFVETHLGGAGAGDILVPAPEKLTWDYLRKIRLYEQQVLAEAADPTSPLHGLSRVLSLADAVLAADPKLDPTKPSNRWTDIASRGRLRMMRLMIPAFYDALHAKDPDTDQHYLRIMFRAREQQDAAAKQALIARLQLLGAEHLGDLDQPIEITGFFVLLTSLIDNMVGDQWKTFGVAIAGIGLTMIVAFRSLRLACIALIPNTFPVLVVSGVMGWLNCSGLFDFRINMGSAMIAAVSLGLSVDSSIHYIFAYQRALSRGQSVRDALAAAHGTVGLSMVLSTLALIVGFSVLATSKFTPTVYFGTLVSLAMLGGLLGNLVILPLMLSAGGDRRSAATLTASHVAEQS